MSTQKHFFADTEVAHARHADPPTSHEAAEKTDVPESHRIVLKHLSRVNGATAEQVFRLCELNGEAITAARVRGALSEMEGSKVRVLHRNGVTASGNRCAVYQVKQ
jgi:hypothetical protein